MSSAASVFGRITLPDADAELRPGCEANAGTFTVQLWMDGELLDTLGADESYSDAQDVIDAVDGFLDQYDVRWLIRSEAALLYAGLLEAKGGEDFTDFLLEAFVGPLG
ncbi:hypothetical protein [Streptomyces sp. NPDC048636]|uniref:hypothetical protein n=1 Tax=Streptomyces sp. NPDC048636 TaxID=3155762 RepID=UPI0034463F23